MESSTFFQIMKYLKRLESILVIPIQLMWFAWPDIANGHGHGHALESNPSDHGSHNICCNFTTIFAAKD